MGAPIIVVLVAMLLVLVVALSLPGLVAVAWIRVFAVPGPVPPLCEETGSKCPMNSDAPVATRRAGYVPPTVAAKMALISRVVRLSVVPVGAGLARVGCRFGG